MQALQHAELAAHVVGALGLGAGRRPAQDHLAAADRQLIGEVRGATGKLAQLDRALDEVRDLRFQERQDQRRIEGVFVTHGTGGVERAGGACLIVGSVHCAFSWLGLRRRSLAARFPGSADGVSNQAGHRVCPKPLPDRPSARPSAAPETGTSPARTGHRCRAGVLAERRSRPLRRPLPARGGAPSPPCRRPARR